MNEYTRIGKGNSYVEVSTDWESGDFQATVYRFKECFTEYQQDELKKCIMEAFDLYDKNEYED